MKEQPKSKRESLAVFFSQAYAPGSTPGGILQAARPNKSAEWDEEEDRRRSENNVESSVKDFDAAVEIVATRKQ